MYCANNFNMLMEEQHYFKPASKIHPDPFVVIRQCNIYQYSMGQILILTLSVTLILSESPKTFYSGVMKFTAEQPSSLHQIGKISKPLTILTLNSLSYSQSFSLRTTRKLFKRNNQYFLQINTTTSFPDPPTPTFTITVQYFITRQLQNLQVFTLNLTSKKSTGMVKPNRLNLNKSRCIVLPIGWTNTTYLSKFSTRQEHNGKFTVYSEALAREMEMRQWVHVQVVVLQERFTECGSGAVWESSLQVWSTKQHPISEKLPEKQGYSYLMGIEELHDAYTGSISNDLSTILTTQNGFKYSSIPLNTSCLYTKPKNTGNSVVFIVFFSIFTGIFGVVVIALSAYCLIKQCERRRKVSTNSEVVLNGGNVGELQGIGDGAIVIGMIGTENVIRMKDAGGNGGGGESESQAGGTERKLESIEAKKSKILEKQAQNIQQNHQPPPSSSQP